jgi:hypothetical protein
VRRSEHTGTFGDHWKSAPANERLGLALTGGFLLTIVVVLATLPFFVGG